MAEQKALLSSEALTSLTERHRAILDILQLDRKSVV